MSKKEELHNLIKEQLDGIRVQWTDITSDPDPASRARKTEQVLINMQDVAGLMREYDQMPDV